MRSKLPIILSRVALGAALLLGAQLTALAQAIPGFPGDVKAYDAREVGLLPPYCMHTQEFRERVPGGSNPAEIERWKLTLGPTYEAMHHYCWGLMKTNRALYFARDAQARRFFYADANNEFDYVIERSPDDFVLLPEILTKKGDNLVRLGRGSLAMVEFERAIGLNAKYWPPYARISDIHKQEGDLVKARQVLERGLSAAPDAKNLSTKLSELESGARNPSPAGQRNSKP